MIVTRQGYSFSVHDNDLSGDWGFWPRFADGTWEPEILDRMPDLLAGGGTYVDIGSWIGPQLVWASQFADVCIGLEPDPTAFDVLAYNVSPFDNVHIYNQAVATHTGHTTITTAGDSMSRTGEGDHVVECVTAADLFAHLDGVALVKIDIEGAEQYVFPDASPTLRALSCPVLLSIHPWVTADPLRDCEGWRLERLAEHEVLLWPV